ncbi:MAG: hypothetical protein RLZZ468_2007 [Cyanobacteriota bacterium]|jgi:hypothetical protein
MAEPTTTALASACDRLALKLDACLALLEPVTPYGPPRLRVPLAELLAGPCCSRNL